jgi:hypothetical protein
MKIKNWIPVIVGVLLISACDSGKSTGRLLSQADYQSLENQAAASLSEREGKIVKEATVFGFLASLRVFSRDTQEHSLRSVRDIAVNAVGVMYEKENDLSEAIDDTGKCSSGGTLVTKGSVVGNSKPESTISFNSSGHGTVTISSCGLEYFNTKIEPITGELNAKADFSGSIEKPAVGSAQKAKFESSVLSSLDGSFSGSIDGSEYKATLKNFGISYEFTTERLKEWKQIKLDPLGHDERVQRKREFLRSVLKCSGSVVIEGKEYECAGIVNWVIEKIQK